MLIPDQVINLIDDGALFVANHSGGKDSQAMLIELSRVIPVSQLLVVHASLGKIEWPGAMELARDQAQQLGLPFIIASADKTLFDMVGRRFQHRPEVPSWPSASTRQCTSDLKRGPIQREVRRYAKANGFRNIVNCLGFRAEESSPRAKRPIFSRMSISNSVNNWYEWLPIHNYVVSRVFQLIVDAGENPHWAYAEGNDRLSCIFCLFGSKVDIQNGARHFPGLLAEYDRMEKLTGYTMHMSRIPLVEIAT